MRDAYIVAGALPRSWNIAASQLWLTTLFPMENHPALVILPRVTCKNVRVFSTAKPTSIPMWTSCELVRASAATSRHWRAVHSPHARLDLSRGHSLSIAAMATSTARACLILRGMGVRALGVYDVYMSCGGYS